MKNELKMTVKNFNIILFAIVLIFSGCKKEEEENVDPTNNDTASYTVTVGVYILNGSTYEDQNKDLTFVTQEDCQSWSRTAQGDGHNSASHDHYNAAKSTSYNSDTETITWTEFGPELDQSSIDATCSAGNNGATKTANKTDYSVDKNFYLKIKSVVEN